MDWMLIIGLAVAGLLLVIVDFFIPGFVLASIGTVLMVASLVICYQTSHNLALTVTLLVGEGAATGAAFYYTLKRFPNSWLGKKMILGKTQTGVRAQTGRPPELVGTTGRAHTVLRPSGTAMFDGKRLDVIAESGIIEAGSPIKVVAVRDNQLVVRQL